jgi:hypothetical protein
MPTIPEEVLASESFWQLFHGTGVRLVADVDFSLAKTLRERDSMKTRASKIEKHSKSLLSQTFSATATREREEDFLETGIMAEEKAESHEDLLCWTKKGSQFSQQLGIDKSLMSWGKESSDLRESRKVLNAAGGITLNTAAASITSLRLIDRHISQVDPAFKRLKKLEELWLTGNKLEQLHAENLPRTLQHLHLSSNLLTSLPSAPQLPHLTGLTLSHNLRLDNSILTAIPALCPSLRFLDLSSTPISSLQAFCACLTRLPRILGVNFERTPITLLPNSESLILSAASSTLVAINGKRDVENGDKLNWQDASWAEQTLSVTIACSLKTGISVEEVKEEEVTVKEDENKDQDQDQEPAAEEQKETSEEDTPPSIVYEHCVSWMKVESEEKEKEKEKGTVDNSAEAEAEADANGETEHENENEKDVKDPPFVVVETTEVSCALLDVWSASRPLVWMRRSKKSSPPPEAVDPKAKKGAGKGAPAPAEEVEEEEPWEEVGRGVFQSVGQRLLLASTASTASTASCEVMLIPHPSFAQQYVQGGVAVEVAVLDRQVDGSVTEDA